MAQNKTKLGLAYARMGKTASKSRPCEQDNTKLTMMMCEFDQSPKCSEDRPQQQGNIYEAILGEMASEHNNYISSLVVNHSKKKSLRETKKKQSMLADDDELQYAASARQPIVVDRLKLSNQFGMPHHGSVEEEQNYERDEEQMAEWMDAINSSRQGSRQNRSSSRPKFFQQQTSQRSDLSTAQKYPKNQIVTTNFETPRDKHANGDQSSFLQHMDDYLGKISGSMSGGGSSKGMHLSSKDSVKEQCKEQAKLLRKLQTYEKKFKEMQLSSHMEVKKLKKRELALKAKYSQLRQHVALLSSQLSRERQERRRFQQFFGQFRVKMNMMRGGSISGKSSGMGQGSRMTGSGIDKNSSKFSGSPYDMTSSCDDILDSFEQSSSSSSIYGSQDARVVFGPSRVANLPAQSMAGSMQKKSSNFFRPRKEQLNAMKVDTEDDQNEWM